VLLDRLMKTLKTFQDLSSKEESFHLNFGHLMALALTPVG